MCQSNFIARRSLGRACSRILTNISIRKHNPTLIPAGKIKCYSDTTRRNKLILSISYESKLKLYQFTKALVVVSHHVNTSIIASVLLTSKLFVCIAHRVTGCGDVGCAGNDIVIFIFCCLVYRFRRVRVSRGAV